MAVGVAGEIGPFGTPSQPDMEHSPLGGIVKAARVSVPECEANSGASVEAGRDHSARRTRRSN